MGEFNIYNEMLDFKPLVELLTSKGERLELERNEYFSRRGERDSCMGYIEKGAFRYTCDDSDGNEHIISYAFEHEFFGNYSASMNNCEALLDIRAIQKSVVYRLTVSEINSYFNSSMDTQYLGRRAAETVLFATSRRAISNYCETAEERYLELIRRCPDILNKIKLKELASCLMVTPETLSRIRRKIVLQGKS